LAHPDIKVNLQSKFGSTPMSLCCQADRDYVVRVMLKDPRVDVTLADFDSRTPLWHASCIGYSKGVEWLIASGRDLGDIAGVRGKHWDDKEYTALEIARKGSKTAALLKKLLNNPAQIRDELRVKLGVLDELAAEAFALTVFLCDDLLHLKPGSLPAATPNPATATTRFFAIAFKLPMELQMILCHRAVGSAKQNILRMDSEAAFKSLARILLLPSASEVE